MKAKDFFVDYVVPALLVIGQVVSFIVMAVISAVIFACIWVGDHIKKSWDDSPLGFINFWFLQWFFIRLVFVYDTTQGKEPVFVDWRIMTRVVPLSGWDSEPYSFWPAKKNA